MVDRALYRRRRYKENIADYKVLALIHRHQRATLKQSNIVSALGDGVSISIASK